MKKRAVKNCFIGFDGFIDSLYHAVKERVDENHFSRFEESAEFAKKILEQSGNSINFELVEKNVKLGGNGPLLAQGLQNLGYEVSLAGAFGDPIHPLFAPLKEKCKEFWSLADWGKSEIIEFDDGKIIFGKLDSLFTITWERILKRIDISTLLEESSLFVSANWTMLPHMSSIWKQLGILSKSLSKKPRHFFVDLADPAKRDDESLKEACLLLKEFRPAFSVTLGLNQAESERVKKVLGIKSSSTKPLAQLLKENLEIDQVVLHNKHKTSAFSSQGYFEQDTFFTPKPKITTGAGDNFNAGFCHGLLESLGTQNSLLSGVAASGYYVRHGSSPTLDQLNNFIHTRCA